MFKKIVVSLVGLVFITQGRAAAISVVDVVTDIGLQSLSIALVGLSCLLLLVLVQAFRWVKSAMGMGMGSAKHVDFEADYANDRLRFQEKYGAAITETSNYPEVDFDGRASIYEAQEAHEERRSSIESDWLHRR